MCPDMHVTRKAKKTRGRNDEIIGGAMIEMHFGVVCLPNNAGLERHFF